MRVRSPRPIESKAALVAALAAGLMIAQQVAGRAARNAFFLSNFKVTVLPQVVIVASLLAILAALAMSRALLRFGPARVVPASFAVSSALFLAEWLLSFRMQAAAALAVYLHMALSGSVMIAGFWSLINERFDPHMGRRLIGWIATGATLGGILGGLAAERVAVASEVATLLPLMAAMNLAGLAAVRAFALAPAHPVPEPGEVGSSRVDLQACKLEYSIVSPK